MNILLLATCLSMVVCVHSLDCLVRQEVDCSPKGDVCDHIERLNDPVRPETCSTGEDRCYLLGYHASILERTDIYTVGGCFTSFDSDETGCFNRAQIEHTFPTTFKKLKKLEEDIPGADKFELCVCRDNFCNGGMKFAVGFSALVTTLILNICVMYLI